MRAILAFLAMLTMAQPAFACAMDGMFGAHRFNPFLNMGVGSGGQSADQETDWSEAEEDYASAADDSESDTADQEMAEYEPRDL